MRVARAALSLGALALGACFYSSEAGKNLETRVDKLDKDLRAEQKAQAEKLDQQLPRIDQKIAEVTKALDSLDQASRRSGADTSVQLQKVIEDLAQLRGQVEAYTHSVDQLQDRAATADRKPAADVPRPTDKKEFFQLAQSKAKAGDIETARALYLDFARKWPKDDLAGDAHFAVGESFYAQDNCPEALPEYGQLIKNFGKSRSVPLAYVRSGDCFARLKNPEAARLAYEQVLKDYPKSPEAKLAQKGLSNLKKAPSSKGKK
ncbi:MAG TPA: tetratricopeptide repeat protein [Myxococcaceae bacterium]|nr:tetratricopeptide repeat protein [Myxococcaceae bacterium]